MAKQQVSKPELGFKHRLAHCLTMRRLGEYTDALSGLDQLCDEVLTVRATHNQGTKQWDQLTRVSIGVMRERVTLLCSIQRYSLAETSF